MTGFEVLWRRFQDAGSERGDLLPELLSWIDTHGLTAEQLDRVRAEPGLQMLVQGPVVDGALPPTTP